MAYLLGRLSRIDSIVLGVIVPERICEIIFIYYFIYVCVVLCGRFRSFQVLAAAGWRTWQET